MSPQVRTVVEPALFLGCWLLVCFGGWAIEKYEAWRGDLPSRAARGARARASGSTARAPHSRTIHAAWCDWRGIRTPSVRSTARSATPGERTSESFGLTAGTRGRATRTQGRPHRPSH